MVPEDDSRMCGALVGVRHGFAGEFDKEEDGRDEVGDNMGPGGDESGEEITGP